MSAVTSHAIGITFHPTVDSNVSNSTSPIVYQCMHHPNTRYEKREIAQTFTSQCGITIVNVVESICCISLQVDVKVNVSRAKCKYDIRDTGSRAVF